MVYTKQVYLKHDGTERTVSGDLCVEKDGMAKTYPVFHRWELYI